MENENAPEAIKCSSPVLDICFHPTNNVLIASTIDGVVEVWKYTNQPNEANQLLTSLNHHTDSCRRVISDEQGKTLYSGSSDQSIAAVSAEGQLKWKVPRAHTSPVHCLMSVADSVLLSGDEDGSIKLWDVRQSPVSGAVLEISEQEDFISDMAVNHDNNILLSTSGDGTLGVHELRMTSSTPKMKLTRKSDEQEDELLSMCILKHGKKVVVGTQEGILNFWSWGTWGDISDRFPGHPQSIDAILKIDESTVCTGSSDGIMRVVSVFPNKLLGVIGDHDDFPIERMRFSTDRALIATASHDEIVRFWDVGFLSEEDAEEDMEQGTLGDASKNNGEDSDDSMDDDSDDSDDDDKQPKERFDFSKNHPGSFFSDLA